jgi:ABC-type glycerol-3-phosphate transport system substrate-binding protein
MNPNKNRFKIILTSVFGFFILLGMVVFATYKSGSTANNNVEISIWGTMNSSVFNDFIEKFKQDKNITLKLKYVQKDISTIDTDILEAIASGRAPDSILIPQELMKRYLDKVYLIPYSSISARAFQDTFVQESDIYMQPNGIFALPFFIDPLVMYWNRDILSSAAVANPPKAWSELPLLAGKISKSDNNANITRSAVSFGEYSNVNNAKALLSALIMQAGSPIVATTDGVNFNSYLYTKSPTDTAVPAVSALSFFTEYSNPKKSVYSWNRSLPSSKQFFLSGDLALYFGFASEAQDLKDKNPNLNFDVAQIPQIVDTKTKVTFGDIYGFAFLRTSPNIATAYNLVSTLISADAVSELLQFENVAPARRDVIAAGSIDPAKVVFYNSALISRAWVDPDTAKTDQIFKSMVEDISSGRMDVDGSVQKASSGLDNLL